MASEYRCATYEEAESLGYDETYSVLLRPDGTVLAALMEPEDRSWYRDGAEAVTELNELRATIARLERERDREHTARTVAVAFAEEMREQADAARADAARMRLAAIRHFDKEGWQEQWTCVFCERYSVVSEDAIQHGNMCALTPDDGWLAHKLEEAVEPYRALVERVATMRKNDWIALSLEARALLGGTPTKEGE